MICDPHYGVRLSDCEQTVTPGPHQQTAITIKNQSEGSYQKMSYSTFGYGTAYPTSTAQVLNDTGWGAKITGGFRLKELTLGPKFLC